LSYEQFKEFHDKHPDLDNSEYYVEFPETNKSTVRSWKSRAARPAILTPAPSEDEAQKYQGLEEEMVKLLCTQTKTNLKELEGLDSKSALIVLRNKQKDQQLHPAEPPTSRATNSSILPTPAPIGQSNKRFGIDPYIVFDDVKNEIRMEIPWDVLMDPEKNRKLGETK